MVGGVVVSFSFAIKAFAGARGGTVFMRVAWICAVRAVLLVFAVFGFMVIEHIAFVANAKCHYSFLGDLLGGNLEVKQLKTMFKCVNYT